MKYKFLLTAFLITFLSIGSLAQAKKAIICLTYDDGLETQISTVVPQLDSVGLKATFFLNSIQGSSQSSVIGQTPEAVLCWTNAAKNGHELANHTLFHACPQKLGWDKSVAIDSYTLEKIVREITTQNALLSLLDPARKTRSFAYPCNNSFIGNTDYSKLIRAKGLVTYARTGGDSNSVIADFRRLDKMQVPSWHVPAATTLKELISFAEKVRTQAGMGIYQFHGVGGQIFAVSKETHKAFLDYLRSHENDYWVTTFSQAMDYISSLK